MRSTVSIAHGSSRETHIVFCCVVCADLLKGAKDKQLKVKGPVRIPTKVGLAAKDWKGVLGYLAGVSPSSGRMAQRSCTPR